MLLSIGVIVAVAVAVSITTRDHAPAGPKLGVAEISGTLPDLSGATLTGRPVTAEDLRGKVVVINFWASWCAPCRREQPDLEYLWKSKGSAGDLAIVGVNYRDDADAARAYLREFGVTYPSLSDNGTLLGRLGIPGLPATVIAGPDGKLRFRILGTVDARLLAGLIAKARDTQG